MRARSARTAVGSSTSTAAPGSMTTNTTRTVPQITAADAEAWEAWLAAHHDTSDEVWIRVAKVGSEINLARAAHLIDAGRMRLAGLGELDTRHKKGK